MSSGGLPPRSEETPLLTDKKRRDGEVYMTPLQGVTPAYPPNGQPVKSMGGHRSMHAMSNMADEMTSIKSKFAPAGSVKKSYSVSADGSISYLTPLQLGRHELYENIPFTAVFGMQMKERNLSRAFASYAAELDTMQADQRQVATTKTHMTTQEMDDRRSQANLLMLDELELDKVMVTTPLIFAVLVAAMSQFLVGYNTGVMNAPSEVVFPGHSNGIWGLAVAAFAIGGPFGANIAGNLADVRGRRGALLINSWIFFLGGIIQALALDMFTIIVSRLIIGFASGFSSVLVPIYLGELAPPNLRGMLGTLTQFSLVVGILIADFLSFPFAQEDKWRLLFAVTALTAFCQLLCAPWLLETPRWLLSHDSESRKARYIIKKLRGLRYDHEVETEVDHFVSAMNAQKVDSSHDTNPASGFVEMFTDKNVRLLVVSCLVLQMAQQLCGINAVFYYSTSFFQGVIDNPLVGTTIVGAVNVLATYLALLLMDICGRRTLILWSSGGMFVCCIVLVFSLLGYFPNMIALLSVNVYVSFFEIGLGPIPWLIVAEMFDAKYVATAMSASCQLNWACNFIVGLIFPYMNKYLKAYSFLPFAVVLLLTFIFTWIWLPETQGTTPEELQAELIKKNTSTVYHNININNANDNPIDLEWRSAMNQLKKEEEEAMNSGTYNYGFQPIDNAGHTLSTESLGPPTDWKNVVSGKGQ